MLAYVNREQLTVTPAQLTRREFLKDMLSDVLVENTGKLMEYRKLMKNPKYRHLYCNSYAK